MNVSGSIECASTAVAEGVRLLDAARPGWWKQINLDTLDMNSCLNCILGQVYGSYLRGREGLGIPESNGDLYGFDSLGGSNPSYETLQYLWVQVIQERRSA